MAKGYPDFFGTSIWPKYGTPINTYTGIVAVPGGAIVDVITINANGVLFSLDILLVGVSDLISSLFIVYADTGEMARLDLDFDYRLTILGGAPLLLGLTYVDVLSFVRKASLSREMPFHDSFVVRVRNNSADPVSIEARSTHFVVT